MRNFWRVLAVLFTLAPTASIAQIPGGGGGSGGNVNVTQWVGTNLAAPTAWGVAPAGGSIVPNMNVNCVIGCSGSGATSTYGAAFPSTGTAIGFTDGANMVAGKVRTPGSGAIATDPAVVVIDPNVLAAALSPVPCKAAATWNASTGLTGTQPAGCDGSAALWVDWGALNGVALGSPSNYGTSPGAVSVQGVNAFVTNSANSSVNGTPTAVSGLTQGTTQTGTITAINVIDTPANAAETNISASTSGTPSTATTLIASNAARHKITIKVEGASPVCFSQFGTAVIGSAGTWCLKGASSANSGDGGSYVTPVGQTDQNAFSMISTGTSILVTAWWQ
jgi:hypothetical protein